MIKLIHENNILLTKFSSVNLKKGKNPGGLTEIEKIKVYISILEKLRDNQIHNLG